MSTFREQNWQAVFSQAAQSLKMNIGGVEVVDNVDQDFIDQSRVVTYALTNAETHASYLGADSYLARPLLERMILQHNISLSGEKLVITRPHIRSQGSSDTVFNVALRYAFIFKGDTVETVETEEQRKQREEDEELAELQRQEDLEKAEKAEKAEKEKRAKAEKEAADKIESDKKAKAAEEQRLKDEETRLKTEQENAAAQEAERVKQQKALQNGNSDEDQFPEEKV